MPEQGQLMQVIKIKIIHALQQITDVKNHSLNIHLPNYFNTGKIEPKLILSKALVCSAPFAQLRQQLIPGHQKK